MIKPERSLIMLAFIVLFSHLALLVYFYSAHERPWLALLAVGKSVPLTYGDCIFVPASGCNPGMGTRERLVNAARFYKAKARPIFLSEGTCFKHERSAFFAYIDSLGIDTNDVYWDTTSFNSTQNVAALRAFAKKRRIKSVLLCTSPFHQRRMMMLLRADSKLRFKVAAMPENIELLSRVSPYRERMDNYVSQEWKKVLYLGFREAFSPSSL